MPVSAVELVKKLMAKAGVTHDGELTGDIPDEVATALDNQLLTIQAATNNHPAVKKVYFAQAYNGLDAELAAARADLGIDDATWAEIEASGGSTKRAVALARKIKELSAKPNGQTETLNAQIVELRAKLADEVKKQADTKTQYDQQLQKIKIQTKLSGMLSGYKTVYDDLPAEAKQAAVEALINKSLQDSDADFTFDEKEALTLKKKDGTNLFGENHTLITPTAFLDKSLSKILKVSGPPAQTTPAAAVPGSTQNQPNTALKEAVAASLSSYTEAAKAVAV